MVIVVRLKYFCAPANNNYNNGTGFGGRRQDIMKKKRSKIADIQKTKECPVPGIVHDNTAIQDKTAKKKLRMRKRTSLLR